MGLRPAATTTEPDRQDDLGKLADRHPAGTGSWARWDSSGDPRRSEALGVSRCVSGAGNMGGAAADQLDDDVVADRREAPRVHPDVDLSAVLAPLLMDVTMQQPAAAVFGTMRYELKVMASVQRVREVVLAGRSPHHQRHTDAPPGVLRPAPAVHRLLRDSPASALRRTQLRDRAQRKPCTR